MAKNGNDHWATAASKMMKKKEWARKENIHKVCGKRAKMIKKGDKKKTSLHFEVMCFARWCHLSTYQPGADGDDVMPNWN